MAEIRICPDAGSLARAAAAYVVARAAEAIADRGRFAVALAGGSTPQAAYALLASDEFAPKMEWPRVHVFWGDERCVPPDHPDSNYRMARETLLDHVPLPASHVHRMPGELEPARAAAVYEHTLRGWARNAGEGPLRFDLILLGLGEDGHTASLFPGTAAIREQTHWVMAHRVDALGAWRITLTPVVINAAAHVAFVVSGAAKAEPLRQVLTGAYQPDALPAQVVRPADGHLLWLVDADAASRLERALVKSHPFEYNNAANGA